MAYSRDTNRRGGDSNGTQRSVNAGVHPCRIKPENLDPFHPSFEPLPAEDGSLISDPRFGSWCSDFHNWNDPLIIVDNNGPSMGGDYQADPGCGYDGLGACCVDGENCASGCAESENVLGCCCINGTPIDTTQSECQTSQGSFHPNWSCSPSIANGDPACHIRVEDGGFCDTQDPRCICIPHANWQGRGDINCGVGACCSTNPTCDPGTSGVGVCCMNYECHPDFADGPGACCANNGTCSQVENEAACEATGGEYLGNGRTCESTPGNEETCANRYNQCVSQGVASQEECTLLQDYYINELGAGDNCIGTFVSTSGFDCCVEGDCCYRGVGGCPEWVDCEGVGDGQAGGDGNQGTFCCRTTYEPNVGIPGVPCSSVIDEQTCEECEESDCSDCTSGGACNEAVVVQDCSGCGGAGAASDVPPNPSPLTSGIGGCCYEANSAADCTGYFQGPGSSCIDTDGIFNEPCGFKTCRTVDGDCQKTAPFACLARGVETQGDTWNPNAHGFWETGIPAGCSDGAGEDDQFGCCVYTTQAECLAPFGDDGFGGTQWLPGVDCPVFGDQDAGDCGFTSSCLNGNN
jgi:hypothetical protein